MTKKRSSQGRVFGEVAVRLNGDAVGWEAIPLHIMQILKIDKLPRLKRIHQSIARAAKLTMPPVFIAPYGWVTPDVEGAIYGRTGAVLVDDNYWWAVELPITTLLYADDILLRRILIHEFSHYFYKIESLIVTENRSKGGLPQRDIEYTTEEWIKKLYEGEDERLKVDLSDWLSENDAKLDIDYHDPVFESIDERLINEWLNMDLPRCTPEIVHDIEEYKTPVSSDILRHAMMLREKE